MKQSSVSNGKEFYDWTNRILTSPAIEFYLEFCEIVKQNSTWGKAEFYIGQSRVL